MFSRLREHLGTAGLVVAIVALVAALAGGAIAANGGGGDGKTTASDGEATASAKAKRGPRGPKGAKGNPGPQGPAGPAGPQGPKGDTGAAGSNGSNGAAGAKGATGPTGPTGDDGTFSTEPLPDGETLTGFWSTDLNSGTGEAPVVDTAAISFPLRVSPAPTAVAQKSLPLGKKGGYVLKTYAAAELVNEKVPLMGPHPCLFEADCGSEAILAQENVAQALQESEDAYRAACPGTPSDPKANPGFLCFYDTNQSVVENAVDQKLTAKVLEEPSQGADEFGGTIPLAFLSENGWARGTWAVTG